MPPVGYKYDEAELTEAAVELALELGFSSLSFGRLARRLGVSDRALVYYFPTKTDLVQRTVAALGQRLMGVLGDAFAGEALPPGALIDRAWPVLTSADADRVFAVFFELMGLAAAGREPYRDVVPPAIEAWVAWLTPQAVSPDPRAAALAVIARLDGLLLLRHTVGPDAADEARSAEG